MAAWGFRRWKQEAEEGALAGWAVAEEVVPVNPPPAAGWKAPEVCWSGRGEWGALLYGWGACCPREEGVEGACHPRPGLGSGAKGAWGTERRSSRGSGAQSLLQKQHLGFRERGAWGLPALLGIPGCADSTEWVLVYLVPEGEGYLVLSSHQASGEAFCSWEALGAHSCGLVRVQETSPGHLGVKRAWQMWLFLLVAKSVVGFLQNRCPCWRWTSALACQPGTVLPILEDHPLQNFHRHHHRLLLLHRLRCLRHSRHQPPSVCPILEHFCHW